MWAKVVDAACLLPQTRKRVFIVGARRRRAQGQEDAEDAEKGKGKGEEMFITEGAVEGARKGAVGGAGDGEEDEFVFPDIPALGRYVGEILEDGNLFLDAPPSTSGGRGQGEEEKGGDGDKGKDGGGEGGGDGGGEKEGEKEGDRARGKKRSRSAMSNNNVDGHGTGGGHLDSFALTGAQWDKVRSSRYDVPFLYPLLYPNVPLLSLTLPYFPLLSLLT